MSQYVDPYETSKPSVPPPAYPGSNQGFQTGPSGPNVVLLNETNVNVNVVGAKQEQNVQVTQVTQMNQVNHADDCGCGFCLGCCWAVLCCTVM
jgi:hypothetical protein